MFTKLRNRFLILNMSITSLVMIAAFAIIYFITYNNIHSDIKNKLNSQAETRISVEEPNLSDELQNEGNMSTSENFSLGDPHSFTIEVDEDGNILEIHSYIEMPEEVYEKAVETAWNNKKNSTTTLYGKKWKYSVAQMKKRLLKKMVKSIPL